MIHYKDLIIARDMPKLESPFVREGEKYLVTNQVNPGYEWVFEDPDTICTEKLDGTDVSIIIRNGEIERIWNRENTIPIWANDKGTRYIIDGLMHSYERGYVNRLANGQWFGELIGPKVGGNKYKLDRHLWLPFQTYVWETLRYKSWGKYPKTYQAISDWFQNDIFSLFMRQREGELMSPEGVVFVNPKTGAMAKLRRDMFPWFTGPKHKWSEQKPLVQTK